VRSSRRRSPILPQPQTRIWVIQMIFRPFPNMGLAHRTPDRPAILTEAAEVVEAVTPTGVAIRRRILRDVPRSDVRRVGWRIAERSSTMNRRDFTAAASGALALAACSSGIVRAAAQSVTNDAAWLQTYAGRDYATLAADLRFRPLLMDLFRNIRCPFLARRVRIGGVLPACLPIGANIRFEHGRFAVLTGGTIRSPELRTLLWIDTHAEGGQSPKAVAAFLRPQPPGAKGRRTNLWVLANREMEDFSYPAVPRHFKISFRRWLREEPNWMQGAIVKLQWLGPSMRIRPFSPELIHVPAARLHRPKSAYAAS
jgi:hypothetical protein